MTALLDLRNVTKKYGPNTVLDAVSLTVGKGEVIGLIGENGAGKSTLLKILAGVHQPDGGSIMLGGNEVRFSSPTDAASHGVGVVHQEQSLLPNLTVAENLVLGDEKSSVRFGFVRKRQLRARASEMLKTVGSNVDPSAVTESLSFAERQMVEVARAVGASHSEHPPLLVLDEPTSVLENEDIEVLYERVNALRELGAVIFVSHRLDEVLRFSDRVYILRDGKLVGERCADTASESELYSLMIGKNAAEEIYSADRKLPVDPNAAPVLSVRNLQCGNAVKGLSLEVAAGEIVSIVGVVGSGREEFARAIFGAVPVDGGTIRLDGEAFRPASPGQAVRRGIGYVPSERRTEGMVSGISVAENIALVHPVRAGGRIDTGSARTATAEDWITRLRIRPNNPDIDINRLSGGNQQKAVIAKWILDENLRLLVLDHPTRGLDIGAKEDLYALFRDLCERGVGLLVLADTLDEAIGLGHRIVVMRDGDATGEFDSPVDAPPAKVHLLEKMM
ncbi:sugar ABC transporter ATP-binding protein [Rhodococcus qingshengii]|uniref:sugar ABC transporter ATP-binding protein n=1 Tax=Rhodococcus TaxID=1827 RepID=UPI001BB0B9C4|nr:sugar ABC transporter ATP-binding protein [Rhodococcus qingshengii]MBS3694138.1 sugar ABC transporter ATP-binding protein [Rhodococcus qingshengii]